MGLWTSGRASTIERRKPMTGIERLRELADGMNYRSVWSCTDADYCERHGLSLANDGGQLGAVLTDIADQIEREADVETVRADAMEAWRWVCDHGGLSHVKDIYNDLRAVVECLGIEWSESELHGLMDVLDRRLMPEGVEWPRYESGEPVRIDGAIADELGCVHEVTSVEVFDDAVALHWNPAEPEECVWVGRGVRARRPTVLAADGKPLREGETVWVTRDSPCDAPLDKGDEVTVRHAYPKTVSVEDETGESWIVHADHLTHERPVVDTWERLEKDANDLIYDIGFHLGDYSPSDFNETGDSIQDRVRDIVRRAKALAERGE